MRYLRSLGLQTTENLDKVTRFEQRSSTARENRGYEYHLFYSAVSSQGAAMAASSQEGSFEPRGGEDAGSQGDFESRSRGKGGKGSKNESGKDKGGKGGEDETGQDKGGKGDFESRGRGKGGKGSKNESGKDKGG